MGNVTVYRGKEEGLSELACKRRELQRTGIIKTNRAMNIPS